MNILFHRLLWIALGCFLCLLFLFSLPLAKSDSTSPILISEVQTNPLGSDTGLEYVELVNLTTEAKDISGWDLDAADLPYFTFPVGTLVPPRDTLRIIFRADGVRTDHDLYTGSTFGSTNMKNTAGAIGLFNSTLHNDQTLVDYMEYGAPNQTHESYALAKGIWTAGGYVGANTEEDSSLQRICSAPSTSCWIVQKSTPGTQLLAELQENTSVNTNTNSGTASGSTVFSELYSNGQKETAGDIISTTPVHIKILASSGSTLTVWKDPTQSLLIEAGTYEEDFVNSGSYTISYHAQRENTQEQLHTVNITVTLPVVPPLFINEVALSETSPKHDFIEFTTPATSMESVYDLSKFSVLIDQTMIPLQNTTLRSGEFYVLTLGDSGVASLEQAVLNPSSMVGTTEQISLLYEGTVVDGVCWEEQPITSSEQLDYANFHEPVGKWSGSCVDSLRISNGTSIIRKEHGMPLSSNQWQVYPVSTKGAINEVTHTPPVAHIDIQGTGVNTGNAPFHLNLTGENSTDTYGIVSYFWNFGDGGTSLDGNPLEHLYTQPGSYLVTLRVVNVFGDTHEVAVPITVTGGTTSTNSTTAQGSSITIPASLSCSSDMERAVRLSEILPNPKGVDTDQEWVELYNPTEKEIAFCNLFLDDEEGGSTPYSLAGRHIPAHGYALILSSESKIVLSNSKGIVRLLLGGSPIDSVTYEAAPEGKSYARMEL